MWASWSTFFATQVSPEGVPSLDFGSCEFSRQVISVALPLSSLADPPIRTDNLGQELVDMSAKKERLRLCDVKVRKPVPVSRKLVSLRILDLALFKSTHIPSSFLLCLRTLLHLSLHALRNLLLSSSFLPFVSSTLLPATASLKLDMAQNWRKDLPMIEDLPFIAHLRGSQTFINLWKIVIHRR